MSEPVERHRGGPGGAAFWLGTTVGLGLAAFGVVGAWSDRRATVPSDLARWFFGAGIVHDAVLLPVVVVVGLVLRRVLPRWAMAPVALGLAWSALVAIVVWPAVAGWGRRADNPSLFPLDYGRNLVATLVVTWLVVLTVLSVRWSRRRQRGVGR